MRCVVRSADSFEIDSKDAWPEKRERIEFWAIRFLE